MRRRVFRIPERLLRVGDRPAGAESGEDRATLVLILATGDLGFKIVREGVAALGGLATVTGKSFVLADLVRMKVGGFMNESLVVTLSAPLARLENKIGSTFSESSNSVTSDAFRLTGDELEAAVSWLVLLFLGKAPAI